MTPKFDIRPYPYQQEILDKLLAEREVRGIWRNSEMGLVMTVLVARSGNGER